MARSRATHKGEKQAQEGDGGAAEVTANFHEEQAQGYSGAVPDKTPNHAYTLAGVVAGERTPEFDEGLAQQPATTSGDGGAKVDDDDDTNND